MLLAKFGTAGEEMISRAGGRGDSAKEGDLRSVWAVDTREAEGREFGRTLGCQFVDHARLGIDLADAVVDHAGDFLPIVAKGERGLDRSAGSR